MRHLAAAIIAMVTFGAGVVHAQDITGAWQGTLQAGRALRMVVRISNVDGNLAAVLLSIDQAAQPIAATIARQGTSVRLTIPAIGGGYEGTLSADGNTIAGTFEQGGMRLPLNLVRATPETAWAIPAAPPALAPMAPGVDPSFDVATIKPSDPSAQGKLFTLRGRQVLTINTTVSDLIAFAYQLHPQQIAGGPGWLASDKCQTSRDCQTRRACRMPCSCGHWSRSSFATGSASRSIARRTLRVHARRRQQGTNAHEKRRGSERAAGHSFSRDLA